MVPKKKGENEIGQLRRRDVKHECDENRAGRKSGGQGTVLELRVRTEKGGSGTQNMPRGGVKETLPG